VERLRAFSPEPIRTSSLYQTEPVGCPAGSPPFINAMMGLVPFAEETPEGLLDKLQHLEIAYGRRPKVVMNEPRPLDLDLILFGSVVRKTSRLTLPHPRALTRRFVLMPLAELAPGLVFPQQSETVSDFLKRIGLDQECVRLPMDSLDVARRM
jgi:2-amino-4-hydroxy-6-hydroxymethyldihydropteridine diphosphokinase